MVMIQDATAPRPAGTVTAQETDVLAIARDVLRREAEAIQALAPSLGEPFSRAVEMILRCEGKVILTAVGKSGHIGRKIAATLSSTGTPAFFVHPTEAQHGDLGMIRARDVVIAISHSGSTSEVLTLLPVIQRIGAKVIAICRTANSPIGRQAAVCLETLAEFEADTLNLAPTTSTTVTLALGDALAIALLRCRGFKREDFAMLHPGGELGKSMLCVSDIMPKGKNPVVGEAATVQEAIIVSNEFNFGGVSVVDDSGSLTGILTDGDIKRVLQRHRGEQLLAVLEGPVGDVMTRNPQSVAADMPGQHVVRMMEERERPTYIFPVVDRDGATVGMVRMHDLVRAGFSTQIDID
jgi:arabinose-5-phosphate isomerase